MKADSSIPRQRFTRLIPTIFVMYTLAYIDRSNIGFGLEGMEKTLHLSPTIAGLAGGIFFLGYLLLQVPGGYFASRYSAVKLVFGGQIIWGILACLTSLVHNSTELLIMRFLLGMAESALFPSLLVIVAKWFPFAERARANSFLNMSTIVASILMGPISGIIVANFSWRWLFLLEGIPGLLWVIVWWFNTADSPQKAKFLSQAERDYLTKEFEEDRKNEAPETKTNWSEVFNKPKVWILVLSYFFFQLGNGTGLWMPIILKNLTGSGYVAVGFLTAIPPIIGIIGMIIAVKHSDKTGERRWHAMLCMVSSGCAFLLSVFLGHYAVIAFIFIVLQSFLSTGYSPCFWSIPPYLVSKRGLGAAMGLINGIGGLGGFFGPTIVGFVIGRTNNTITGLAIGAMAFILSGLLILFVKYEAKPVEVNPTAKVTGV